MRTGSAVTLLMLAVIAAAGCDTIRHRTATWIGQPAAALVKAWGAPYARHRSVDPQVMQYVTTRSWSEYPDSEYETVRTRRTYRDKDGKERTEWQTERQLRRGAVAIRRSESCTMSFMLDATETIRDAIAYGSGCGTRDIFTLAEWPGAK